MNTGKLPLSGIFPGKGTYMLKKRIAALALAVSCALTLAPQLSVSAEKTLVLTGYRGDFDANMSVNATDVKIMADYLHCGAFFDQNDYETGDLTSNQILNSADFSVLKRITLGLSEPQGIYIEIDEPDVPDLTLADMPSSYTTAMEWIWTNRIVREGSTTRQNLIFDQIIAGGGTLNYVVRWQSSKTVTLQQRKDMEGMIQRNINSWTDYLSGYDGWPYDHVDVNIVAWAVADKNVLLDLQPDEVVYTDTIYDSLHNDNAAIPSLLPCAPDALSRFEHFTNKNYVYPGTRFDMYIWATEGFGFGGAGGDWGQRMSDDYYLSIINSNLGMILQHEIGHGFGLTDFYGGEGESDGFPPGGFPGGGTSIMMAGSSGFITDFDSWMLRYVWSKIKNESGRFSY